MSALRAHLQALANCRRCPGMHKPVVVGRPVPSQILLIGLIPGLGDTSTAAFSSLILVHGVRAGVPRVVLLRMALNILINSILGALPGLGDLFSAWFKSNQQNYRLLKRHSGGARLSTTGDWIFLILLVTIVLVIAVTIALAVGYMAFRMGSVLFGGS